MPKGKTEEHYFCCINCGRTGIPLMRPLSRKREKFHRKKMFCPFCGRTVNHIECSSSIEVEEFKTAFAMDMFKEEAALSIKECAENV